MGRPVVALCDWQDFNYPAHTPGSARYDRRAPAWEESEEPPTPCRASLGDKKLTVWLPKGARIVCRLSRMTRFACEPMGDKYYHVYGSHDRMTRTRIVIRLTEYPNA